MAFMHQCLPWHIFFCCQDIFFCTHSQIIHAGMPEILTIKKTTSCILDVQFLFEDIAHLFLPVNMCVRTHMHTKMHVCVCV